MKTKFIVLSLIAAGICTMSCRQDDESPTEEAFQSSLKEQNPTEESRKNIKDSVVVENAETDPPRNGTHWIVDEAIKTVKNDSILLPKFNVETGLEDPPRNGTHWKTK
ncbi:hypothetical protein [Chryseobacterium schmidteae]|uniref:hypothetical protein n=1 Tax=Chryseobacterium schmidteae TaxID=2730404 RepID=UPI00158B8675|nr:hypothetical protein [Chryseobacterium schmidteae]